ncbi:Na/Pi cotransporter family protein [Halonatronum saccharophilum]|uniref:Na/Pi cotransporter family protein n=1 Tax=Halonatronum saccharophilum TaxID=150060 RepID=UPI00047F2CC5|nr:Na/Pi symporter [Halonatronum saccharophilum]
MGYIIIGKFILGLLLFLVGLKVVKDSFYQASHNKIEYIMKRLTKNIFLSIITGILITSIIQSSSATIVIIISLVNAKILSLEEGVGVIMGANIGTTATVQLLSFNLEDYLWLITLIGLGFYLLYYIKRNDNLKYIARGIIGFAILFAGLEVLSSIILNLKRVDSFISLLTYLSVKPMWGILVGIVVTALIQSSSALTGVVVVLAKGNMISLALSITIALGSNIGTCITAFIAGLGTSKTARRVAVADILFNIIGVLAIIPLLPFFIRIMSLTSLSLTRQIANSHTVFNIFNTLLILVWRKRFIDLVVKIT